MIELLTLPIIGAAGLAVYWRGQTAASGRAAMLRSCVSLLTEAVHGKDGTGYGTLEGRFAGVPVAVRLIPEAVAFRRLPQLWLSVSVHRPTGFAGTVDILRRVAGAEFYAPATDLPVRYAVPPTWPGETLVRGSPGAESIVADAASPVAEILTEPRVKEILLTPRGVRIVSQVCEGDRGAYLLLRESRFSLVSVDPDSLRSLLLKATALSHLFTKEASHVGCSRAAA
jgi:hypothetical protein